MTTVNNLLRSPKVQLFMIYHKIKNLHYLRCLNVPFQTSIETPCQLEQLIYLVKETSLSVILTPDSNTVKLKDINDINCHAETKSKGIMHGERFIIIISENDKKIFSTSMYVCSKQSKSLLRRDGILSTNFLPRISML